MTPTLALACELIRRRSITPDDAGCLEVIAERLRRCGFTTDVMVFEDVTNLWAYNGSGEPVFTFAGHTDVVPSGDLDAWDTDPFEPTVRDELLYGRGAADMKGSLAAMVTAIERFVTANPDHRGTLSVLFTSDEEGIAVNGTVKVIEELKRRGQLPTWCLIGEPSSHRSLGDVIRNGRRGSLNGRLTVHGVQGHVAYPDKAANPIHLASAAIVELCEMSWDEGNEYYPPTTFQISNINGGTGAENVIPADLNVLFNFRYSSASSAEDLQRRVEDVLDKHEFDYEIRWHLSGEPFLTPAGTLVDAVAGTIADELGTTTELSTGGGTSDGRFIAPTGAEVVEFGPVNESIHKVNEHVRVADLERLSLSYEAIVRRLLR